jgi:AbrB family looped-hinge helix DNA binding protein
MDERIRVGARGQVVIPKKIRKRLDIEQGVVLEVKETGEGIVLKPYNPVRKLRGLGRGLFGDPVKYQEKLRKEWKQ